MRKDDWIQTALDQGHGVCHIGRGLTVFYTPDPDQFNGHASNGHHGMVVVPSTGNEEMDRMSLEEAIAGQYCR